MEKHEIRLVPARRGSRKRVVVCGPTCTDADKLGCWTLDADVEPGDNVLWLSAGAYHIPLETRFSQGVAPVVWFNALDEAEVIRERETHASWWAGWNSGDKGAYLVGDALQRSSG